MNNPQTREASFIHGSTQYQLVAETYIVGALYAAITFGFILLNEAASPSTESQEKKKSSSSKPFFGINNNMLAYIGLGLVVIFFSLLLSIFRSKYRGYPYSFLFS
ncbi:hypothetical protein ANCCAN_19582 [Ancylostoma caninum]|nr:hypothetical protein ANCCAN_19582 [Ancylostoma caninum]